jgi:uncharacterized protein YqhQ
MRILGGSATGKSVTLYSDEFRVTAMFNKKTKIITSKTVQCNNLEKFLLKHPRLFPRFLAFALEVLSRQNAKFFLLLGGLFIFFTAILMSMHVYMGIENAEETTGKMEYILRTTRPFLLLFVLVIYRKFVAGFHATEHMATSAYAMLGSKSVERIVEGSRFSEHCMGRFLAPGIVIAFLTLLGLMTIGEISLLISLIVWEAILWTDTLIGLHTIGIFAKSTEFLQRYVTTKPPKEHELRTGKEALRQLLIAHNKI